MVLFASLTLPGETLAGFFVTNYSAAPVPGGLEINFGEFPTRSKGKTVFFSAYGARMPTRLLLRAGSPP